MSIARLSSAGVSFPTMRAAGGSLWMGLVCVGLLGCAGDGDKADDSAAAGPSDGTDGEDGGDGGDPPYPADSFTFDSDDLFPEGIAWSTSEQAFFVGSLTAGSIVRVEGGSGAQSTVYAPESGVWMTLGLKTDESRGELVVCAIEDYGTELPKSELQRFSLADGALQERVALAPGAVCNDVTVGTDGTVYLTEREGPRLWAVPPGGDAEVLIEDEVLAPDIIGLNGIVTLDASTLLVGKYAAAQLIRVDLGAEVGLTEVTISGDGLGTIPDGPDGMFLDGEVLLVAANQSWFTVESSDGWASATTVAHSPPAAIAAITVAEGRRFGLKGEVVPYVLGTPEDLPFQILHLPE